jgi:predicted nucleic acid-binding protein
MKIYIDSNVFVSNVCDDEDHHTSSKEFIDFILTNNLPEDFLFLTSRFTEVEVASAIFRKTKNEDRARATLHKLERPWREKFLLLPKEPSKKISLDDLIVKLVETALKHGTRFGDTVHANDVESYNIDFLVTWNIVDFIKMKEKIVNLQVVTPVQMLEELKKMIKNEKPN